LIILGAGSNFILILFLKKFIPNFFNTYTLYVTYIGIVASFGLFGFDQIFLRLAKIDRTKIIIGKDVFSLIILSLFFVPIFYSVYFSSEYQNLNFLSLFISGISINAIIMAYNLFRLKKRYITSQIFKSGYRVAFLIIILIFYLVFSNFQNTNIIKSFAGILFLFGSISVISIFKYIKTSKKKTPDLFNFFLSFSFNIAIITLVGFGERILIANELGEDSLGKYFYYSTVFLFPIMLLQQYIGFKELVNFKEEVSKKKVLSKLKTISFLGAGILLAILITVFVDAERFFEVDIQNDLTLIILLSVLGITKLFYGLFSAILGAKGSSKNLYIINILTLLIILILLMLLFIKGITLNLVVLSLIIVFLFRSIFIYWKYVR